ncbi:MAG: DEAD/DEAH box helicase, partial [Deltaproteobacteria bacterium]
MPLVFDPAAARLFVFGDEPSARKLASLANETLPRSNVALVLPTGRAAVPGAHLPLLATCARFEAVPTADLATLPASFTTWILASKLALELTARERVVPVLVRRNERVEARWAAALSSVDDAAQVAALARAMPPAAHAVAVAGPGADRDVWAPEALLRAYLDTVVDTLVRDERGGPEVPAALTRRPSLRRDAVSKDTQWEQRWRTALVSGESRFEAVGFTERTLVDDLVRWGEPAVGARDRLRACFRLELPASEDATFVLTFLLQSPDDPSLLVNAKDVWRTKGRSLEALGRAFRDPQESLLEALGRASRLFTPIQRALASPKPESIQLDPAQAWTFLGDAAPALTAAGFGVLVPGELTATGQRRLRLRMRVGGSSKVAGAVTGTAALDLDELLAFEWEAAIGDDTLSARDLDVLARQKSALVRYRGEWVAIDPRELTEIRKRLSQGPGSMTMRDALRAALTASTRDGTLTASVRASGPLLELLERVRTAASTPIALPRALQATLRPYQERGLAWLATMGALGLGAILADDMGLGKTVQLLAYVLRRSELSPQGERPTLLVAPTSVVGNWEREIERFAPSLTVVRHYGPDRAREAKLVPRGAGVLVITTYALLRRDAALLAGIEWDAVVLDEAQNIKNSSSATAGAARALPAAHRFALTGTPVENRLAELWSLLEFANPGLLGPLGTFRREFAVPVERYGDEEAAKRLRAITGPFVLRRMKSDPTIIADLPAKNEMKVICTLTREQASLYQAVVNEEMRRI